MDSVLRGPVTIVGTGMLGRRIGLVLATRGGVVRLCDSDASALTGARAFIDEQLPGLVSRLAEKGEGHRAGTVELHDDLGKAVEGSGLIIEAVPESADLKRQVLGQLDELADPAAVLGSNSSSYPVAEFVSSLAHPERVLNVHFHNPPDYPAVDLLSSGRTKPEIISGLKEMLLAFGLHPFESTKADSGFPFNRLLEALTREALLIVADEASTPELVDSIWKVDTGLPWGPFSGMDEIGLDVALAVEQHRRAVDPRIPAAAAELLERYVAEGRLGRKAGRGFFRYDGAT